MKGPISNFVEKHYKHFNAAALVDAAKGYEAHLTNGGKMMVTLAGAMIDEVVPMMNHRIFHVLPVTDSAGRAIVFVDMTKRDYAIYSEKQEIRVYLYILETIVQNRRLCRRGITFLSTGKNSEKKHFSRKFAQLRREAENCSPIHVRAVHLCHPSTIMN